MARSLLVVALALASAACMGPRVTGASPEAPTWLDARVAEAESSMERLPDLSDVPTFPADANATQEWRKGIAEMADAREALLSDPARINPDAAADAEAFTRQSRAQAERDLARQAVAGDDDAADAAAADAAAAAASDN